MERLQWGFPIATALSLNMPTSINGKKKTSHGLTRNFTEKAEAETRKKTEAAEAFATESHGKKNKNKIPREVDENPVQNQKVRMERLQWGFPIATALSLNRPTSINAQ